MYIFTFWYKTKDARKLNKFSAVDKLESDPRPRLFHLDFFTYHGFSEASSQHLERTDSYSRKDTHDDHPEIKREKKKPEEICLLLIQAIDEALVFLPRVIRINSRYAIFFFFGAEILSIQE